MDSSSPTENTTVFSTAPYHGWLVTFVLIAIVSGLLAIPPSGISLVWSLLGIFFGILGASLIANVYVTADAEGIRWGSWRGKQRARWEEIRDFYAVLPRYSPGLGSEVVTSGGTKLFIPDDWTNRDRLREMIVERAVHATATHNPDGMRQWLVKGTRPADFPMTFGYDAAAIRKERKTATAPMLVIVPLCAIPFVFIAANLPFLLAQYPALLLCLFAALLTPQLVLVGSMVQKWFRGERARRDAWERAERGERFVAHTDGLTMYEGGEGRTIAWDSIVGYDFVLRTPASPTLIAAPICRIRSADGREFHLTNRISDFSLLQYLLRHLSPEAVEAHQDREAKEALGGVAARWTGGEEGKGDRVYHCRTRTLRTSLIIFSLFSLGVILVVTRKIIARNTGPAGVHDLFWNQFDVGLLVYLLLMPLGVNSAMLFWTERIILRRSGLVRRFVNREIFVPWEEVTEVREEGGFLKVMAGHEQVISLIPFWYAYGSEIKERIAEYRRPFVIRVTQADAADAPLTMTASPMPPLTEVVQIVQR